MIQEVFSGEITYVIESHQKIGLFNKLVQGNSRKLPILPQSRFKTNSLKVQMINSARWYKLFLETRSKQNSKPLKHKNF